MSVFERIRGACAQVARRARAVRIDEGRIESLAPEWAADAPSAPSLDPAHHHLGDDASTLAYVLTLDTLNFGSGWFPQLHKRPGLSGYFTLATALKERFESEGSWDARALRELGASDCTRVFGQERAGPEIGELMELFARALNDLGSFLVERHAGRFGGPVEAAGGSAERLVAELAEMPLFRDVVHYDEIEVPFYKRAQLAAADLAAAFRGRGPGRFDDLDELTLFADNLVPHVLRCEGVLVYAAALERRIDSGERIAAGSSEEVEIRACAVHAVELAVAAARAAGARVAARDLDSWLWNRGHRPELKALPRHRTRTTFY